MMRWNSRISAGSSAAASLQQRHRRAPDGGQRLAQLVAHQAEELGAQPLDLVERRQVLKGHDHRPDIASFRADRRDVDQRPDAAPVGDGEHDLLGAQGFTGVELLRDGELAQGYLAPVGEAQGHHLQELLGRMAGRAQALRDAPRLAVDRQHPAARRIQHQHPDRGGVDQGLEVGPGVALVAVGARIHDRGGGLGGEQGQHFLVLVAERLAVGLVGEEEAADVGAAVAHRRALEGAGEHPGRLDAKRAHVDREVGAAQRTRQFAEVFEQSGVVGPGVELKLFFGCEAQEHEFPGRAVLVDGGDDAPAGAGERPGALHHLAEHGVEVEARVDLEDGRIERGDARAQRLVLPLQVAGLRHRGLLRSHDGTRASMFI